MFKVEISLAKKTKNRKQKNDQTAGKLQKKEIFQK